MEFFGENIRGFFRNFFFLFLFLFCFLVFTSLDWKLVQVTVFSTTNLSLQEKLLNLKIQVIDRNKITETHLGVKGLHLKDKAVGYGCSNVAKRFKK